MAYGAGLGLSALAALISSPLRPLLGADAALLVMLVPVMAGAWLGGLRPGLAATLFGAVAAAALDRASAPGALALFGVEGALISAACEHTRRLRREVRDGEGRFAKAFHVSPAPAMITAVDDGRILDVNERFEQLVERPRGDAIGRTAADLRLWAQPLDRGAFLERLLAELRIRDLEAQLVTAGGDLRDAIVSAELLDMDGRACVLTTIDDVTVRRRAEADLRYLMANARCLLWQGAVFDNDPAHPTLEWETSIATEEAGQSFAPLLQLPGEPYLKAWYRLRHPEDQARVDREATAAIRASQSVYRSVFRCQVRDGSYRWFEEQVNVESLGPDRWRVVGVSFDVTEQRAQQERLAEREEQLRLLVEGASEHALYMLDPAGLVVMWNAGGERLYGFRAADILRRPVRLLFPPDAAGDTTGHELEQANLQGRSEVEGLRQRKDGSTFWAHIITTPLYGAGGQLRGYAQITRDITERRRLEERYLQAQKMESVGQLAGGIAHDFNNLLTVIQGHVELAMDDMAPGSAAYDDLQQSQQAMRRAVTLVRQLLAFARRQSIYLTVINLNDLVTDVQRMLRRLITENIELSLALDPALQLARVDSGQIEQVLINLALNARDAMPDGGRITIETANVALDARFAHGHVDVPSGAYVMLAVSDTGHGIPPEVQAHVFEPFFTTKPPGKGSGLGLATCYGIVKQHGGTIWLYSEEGRGTVVKIYLPRTAEPVADSEPPAPGQAAERPQGDETILVVEDEPGVRAVAVRTLRDCGYTVLEAADGEDALRIARSRAPGSIHMLLTDVVMPRMGGMAAARQIRALHPAIAVLLMSGYPRHASLPDPQGLPDAPLLEKPFSGAALATAVRSALDAARDRGAPR